MNMDDWIALGLTVKLACYTMLILLVIVLPLAWWLAHTQQRVRHVIEAVAALPLVLPPTVLGFYLLLLLGANGPLATSFGMETLAFSFTGLVIGSLVYSFPFALQPVQNAFSALDKKQQDAARVLGISPVKRFFYISLPQARRGIITAAVLTFAHTLGEFGVVLMIGGNIRGETQVVSIAIFEHVESLEYAQAHVLSAVLLGVSFVLLLAVYWLNGGYSLSSLKSSRGEHAQH